MSEYLQKIYKVCQFNITYLVFVVYSIEYKLKRTCKSLYSVFINILHNVPTSLESEFVRDFLAQALVSTQFALHFTPFLWLKFYIRLFRF